MRPRHRGATHPQASSAARRSSRSDARSVYRLLRARSRLLPATRWPWCPVLLVAEVATRRRHNCKMAHVPRCHVLPARSSAAQVSHRTHDAGKMRPSSHLRRSSDAGNEADVRHAALHRAAAPVTRKSQRRSFAILRAARSAPMTAAARQLRVHVVVPFRRRVACGAQRACATLGRGVSAHVWAIVSTSLHQVERAVSAALQFRPIHGHHLLQPRLMPAAAPPPAPGASL